MITIYKKNDIVTNDKKAREIELRGLSTDTKPTQIDNKDVVNGTIFLEIDTGKVYMFDLTNKQWKEI